MKWLNTIRWKNLIIIWISIITIIAPHFNPTQFHLYFEFILWGIVCSTIAAIGNITNDLLDVKQDRENKKENIFIDGKNRISAFILIALLIGLSTSAILFSMYAQIFSLLALVSFMLLLLYNFFLKKIILVGNITVAILTTLIFLGINYIVQSRLSYFSLGFDNKQIELLACFAFITTLGREILKDAEDRKGDKLAGVNTIAKYLSDKWMAVLVTAFTLFGCWGVYLLLNTRQVHFTHSFYLYAGWVTVVSIISSFFMFTQSPSKYVIATRIIKGGMLGCLIIYLLLSL